MKKEDTIKNKTNALRILDSKNVSYEVLTYDNITSGIEVAKALNINPDFVYKTLVTVNDKKEHFVFMIPVALSLDLKKASKVTNSKYIEMIPQKELLPLTGYIHGGCSPIGMKKEFPTFIDELVLLNDDIYFSSGKVGMQVKLKVKDLLNVIDIKAVDVTM